MTPKERSTLAVEILTDADTMQVFDDVVWIAVDKLTYEEFCSAE